MQNSRYTKLDNLTRIAYMPSPKLGADSYVWLRKTPAPCGAVPPSYRYLGYDAYVDGKLGYWGRYQDWMPPIVKSCEEIPAWSGYPSYPKAM